MRGSEWRRVAASQWVATPERKARTSQGRQLSWNPDSHSGNRGFECVEFGFRIFDWKLSVLHSMGVASEEQGTPSEKVARDGKTWQRGVYGEDTTRR